MLQFTHCWLHHIAKVLQSWEKFAVLFLNWKNMYDPFQCHSRIWTIRLKIDALSLLDMSVAWKFNNEKIRIISLPDIPQLELNSTIHKISLIWTLWIKRWCMLNNSWASACFILSWKKAEKWMRDENYT